MPELVKIGPTVQGPMKSWAMAATTRAQHMGKKQTVQRVLHCLFHNRQDGREVEYR